MSFRLRINVTACAANDPLFCAGGQRDFAKFGAESGDMDTPVIGVGERRLCRKPCKTRASSSCRLGKFRVLVLGVRITDRD
jgi:hypothetical protein